MIKRMAMTIGTAILVAVDEDEGACGAGVGLDVVEIMAIGHVGDIAVEKVIGLAPPVDVAVNVGGQAVGT